MCFGKAASSHLALLISSGHVLLRHAKGGRPEISVSYRGAESAWIPIMCQLFRMRSNCTVGRGPCGPLLCGFPLPPLGTQPSPPAHCLPDPSYHYNHRTAPHPCLSVTDPHHPPKTLPPPITTSPLFHIPTGALVKSNPIIRHSAVHEKKENFPLVNSRLPFFFSPSHLFTPSGGKMTLRAPWASCLCLSSGLIYPFFLSPAPSFPLFLQGV